MKKMIVLALTLIISYAQAATEVMTSPKQGDVQFEATGKPSMLKIKGKGEGAVAALNFDQGKINGQVSFKLSTLDTGIDLRDEHMKEKYLEVKQYPEAIFTFKNFVVPATWSVKNPVLKETPFSGTMKLHGVEHEVKGLMQIDNNKFAGHANYEINLSDFKIDIPTYLGVKVADTVKVAVNFDTMTVTETKTDAAARKK